MLLNFIIKNNFNNDFLPNFVKMGFDVFLIKNYPIMDKI